VDPVPDPLTSQKNLVGPGIEAGTSRSVATRPQKRRISIIIRLKTVFIILLILYDDLSCYPKTHHAKEVSDIVYQ
jgi:hypothetical protein